MYENESKHVTVNELKRDRELYLPHADSTPAYHAYFQYHGVDRLGEIQVIAEDHMIMYQFEKGGSTDENDIVGHRRFNFDKIESDIELIPIP